MGKSGRKIDLSSSNMERASEKRQALGRMAEWFEAAVLKVSGRPAAGSKSPEKEERGCMGFAEGPLFACARENRSP
jgi:hypothetical protein